MHQKITRGSEDKSRAITGEFGSLRRLLERYDEVEEGGRMGKEVLEELYVSLSIPFFEMSASKRIQSSCCRSGEGDWTGRRDQTTKLTLFIRSIFLDPNQPVDASGKPHSRKIGPAFSGRVHRIWSWEDPAELL